MYWACCKAQTVERNSLKVIDSGKAGGKRGRKLRVVAEARFNYFIDKTFEGRGRADWNRSQVGAAYSAVHYAVADGKSHLGPNGARGRSPVRAEVVAVFRVDH